MMKYLLFIALIFCSFTASANSIEDVAASNGVHGLLAEDHTLPIIAFKISFRASGSAYDPEDKQGLSTFVSAMLDEGAGNLTGVEFQRALEDNAAYQNAESDKDNFHIEFKTLTKNRAASLDLLHLALTAPRFDADAVARIKSQLVAMVRKQREEPVTIAEEKLNQIFFDSHPYSHKSYGDEASLKKIGRKDLVNFADKNFTANRLVISASGDLTEEEFKEILDKYFATLKKGEPIKEVPEFTAYPAKDSNNAIHMDLPQSHAVFALKGVKRDDPDYYKAHILNYIIGAGEFESRLMREVREKRALAYSVYTTLEPYMHAGIIVGSVSTRKEKMDESLQVISAELKNIADNGVTDDELATAKNNILISFPLSLDSNSHLAEFMNVMQLYNLGSDYLEKRNQYIGKVGKEDVNAMAARLLKGSMVNVRVGE